MYAFNVAEDKKIDVIIDTDAKNEADDQYAIVHALLSPKLNVKGLVATHFSKRRTCSSMMASYEECKKLVSLLGMDVPVWKGNLEELSSETDYEVSEGSKFIIAEAHKSKGILNIAVMGALTNLAAALLYDPSIKDKIRVLWVGGRANIEDKEGFEANARNDILSVNIVMRMCDSIVQIPSETYIKFQTSLAELEVKVKPCGDIGSYLFEQLVEFNYSINRFWTMGESWNLGDNTVIAILLNRNCAVYKKRKAFQIDEYFAVALLAKEIEMVIDIDSRYALEDLFSKLRLNSKRA